MSLDPTIATTLNTMVADINAKEKALADASDANTTAQAAALTTTTAAAVALAEQSSARGKLTTSIEALETYLGTL